MSRTADNSTYRTYSGRNRSVKHSLSATQKKVLFYRRTICLALAIAFVLASIMIMTTVIDSSASESKEVSIVYESINVISGDTLTSIAREHNDISVCSNKEYMAEVKRLNNLVDNKLHAGSSIIIPVYLVND